MHALIMGHRRGLSRALEKLDIPYSVWNAKPVRSKNKAKELIQAPYPEDKHVMEQKFPSFEKITHVIAGSEDTVFPASKVRRWVGARRNPQTAVIRCTDKLSMKHFLSSRGVPMTDFLASGPQISKKEVIETLGTPLVVKPRISSGGRGLVKYENENEIPEAFELGLILEKNIQGKEGSVESFVCDGKITFQNVTKYRKIGHLNLVPGDYSRDELTAIHSLNETVLHELGIEWGISHLEFYVTTDGVLFGEVALRPPGGYLMEAMAIAYGANFWEIFARVELGLSPLFPSEFTGDRKLFAASAIFYPSPGRVCEIRGLESVSNLKSLKKIRIKAEFGEIIDERQGVGQDYGYALFGSESFEQLSSDLDALGSQFEIVTE